MNEFMKRFFVTLFILCLGGSVKAYPVSDPAFCSDALVWHYFDRKQPEILGSGIQVGAQVVGKISLFFNDLDSKINDSDLKVSSLLERLKLGGIDQIEINSQKRSKKYYRRIPFFRTQSKLRLISQLGLIESRSPEFARSDETSSSAL